MHSGLREPVLFALLSREIWPAMGWVGAGATWLAMGAGMCVGSGASSNASSSARRLRKRYTGFSPLLNTLCLPHPRVSARI